MVAGQAINRRTDTAKTVSNLLIGLFRAVVAEIAAGNDNVRLTVLSYQVDDGVEAVAGLQSEQVSAGVGVQVGISDLCDTKRLSCVAGPGASHYAIAFM